MLKNNKNSKYLYKFLFANFCKKCCHSTFIIMDSKLGKHFTIPASLSSVFHHTFFYISRTLFYGGIGFE